MTDEYIRRVEAEEAIEEYCCRMCKECSKVEGGCVSHAQHCEHLSGEEILKPVKSADVQPVRRGQWLTWDDSGFTKCSCCNSEYYIADLQEVGDSEGFVEFCPNCGAKMDGDRDD